MQSWRTRHRSWIGRQSCKCERTFGVRKHAEWGDRKVAALAEEGDSRFLLLVLGVLVLLPILLLAGRHVRFRRMHGAR